MKKPFVFLIFVTFLNLSGLLAQNSSAAIDGSSNEEVSVTPCSNNLNSEESVSEKLPRTSPLMMLRLGSERSDNNSFYQDEEADREPLLQHERLRESIDGGYELIPLSLREEIVSDTLAEGMSEVLNENPLDAQLIRTLSEKRAQETMLCLRSLNTACFVKQDRDKPYHYNTTLFACAFWSKVSCLYPAFLNEGLKSALVLNSKTAPFYFEDHRDIAPTIVPVGFKMYLNHDDEEMVVPSRTPTAEENQKVRSLIKEALKANCDVTSPESTIKDFYDSLDAPENRDRVLTVGEIKNLPLPIIEEQSLAADIESDNTRSWLSIRRASLTLPISPDIFNFAHSIAQRPGDGDELIDFAQTNPIDEELRNKGEEAFEQIDNNLKSPWSSLASGCWNYAKGYGQRVRLLFRNESPGCLLISTVIAPAMVWGFCSGVTWMLRSDIRLPYISKYDFKCSHPLPLINRTIDINDHMIGLNIYQDYAELRYRALNTTSPSRFSSSQWDRVDWSSLLTKGTAYEKALLNEFHNEDRFATALPEQGCWIEFNPNRMLGGRRTPNNESLDWLYANYGEPDWSTLSEERVAYEKALMEKYINGKDQGNMRKVYSFLLRKDLIFDARLRTPILLKKRDEIKRNMTAMVREYRGIDMKKCWEIAQKEYGKAKAQQKERKEKADDGWYWFAFKSGFGGAAMLGGACAFVSSGDFARRAHDPLIGEIDRAFHRGKEAFTELRENLGVGSSKHEYLLDVMEQAQQHDSALVSAIRGYLISGGYASKIASLDTVIDQNRLGATIIRAIRNRIKVREEVLMPQLREKIAAFQRRKKFLFLTTEPPEGEDHTL